jgi:uncharacterized OB-fold protein
MNSYFWRSGEAGRLQILRCSDCRTWIHPYAGLCPKCRSQALAPQPVSGRGTVVGFTVNFQPWFPNLPTPYVIALVELEEQSNIRLVTNLMTCPVEDVRIGLPVEVYFEPHEDVFIPLFRPRPAAAHG